jgi:hypothetical protein
MVILQLVSENLSKASGVNPGKEFVLGCEERYWAIVIEGVWAGVFGQAYDYSMFLSWCYVFV